MSSVGLLCGVAEGLLDPQLFGDRPRHVCGVRVALNMVARKMNERGVDPDDRETIRAINVEVAGKRGILLRRVRNRANGHPRQR